MLRTAARTRSLVESLGGAALGLAGFLGGASILLVDTLRHLVVGPFRGTPVPWKAVWTQAVRAGPRSLPVVVLVDFFVGLILALIGGKILMTLGFTEYIGKLMGQGMVIELGPLLTGIIMTGYIGASYTAEIASMVVNEEITALRTMALNPVRLVAAPRLIAVTIMVPCVTVVGTGIGLMAGLMIGMSVLEVGVHTYWEHVWLDLTTTDIWRGATKSVFFGVIIGCVGCYKGFRVEGGAEGVGRATTSSVVTSIVAIIVVDAILNYVMLFR